MSTKVTIEIEKSLVGQWRTVVFFDEKEVCQAGPFDDQDTAIMWAGHLKKVALEHPTAKLVE